MHNSDPQRKEIGAARWVQSLGEGYALSPQPLQSASSPPVLQASVANSPRQSDDGGTSHMSHPLPDLPVIPSGAGIELSEMPLREMEESPPPEEQSRHDRTRSLRTEGPPRMCSHSLCGVAIFLALVNIVSGMTASHGDNWKLAFVG
jgi:hypothetical protein